MVSPLSSLLLPLTPKDFFRDHWDRAAVFIDGAAGRFDPIVRGDDFAHAIFAAKLGDHHIRFLNKAIGGREDSLDYFLRKKAAWTGPQSLSQLAQELHKGTLVYVGIEDAVPSAKNFCRSLLPDLKCQMCINAYFSAGQDASAFDAHFDPQDVFILQLEGEKEWQLWERERVCNPISGYPVNKSVPQPSLPADQSIVMTPGDLLYVPRGMWHWPRSLGDTPSLHLTLTLVAPKPMDVIQWLTQMLSNEPDLRSALPVTKHQDNAQHMTQSLDQAINFLFEKLTSPQAKTMAVAYMMQQVIKSVMPGSSAKGDGENLL